jgi:integration host factor subunit alpha
MRYYLSQLLSPALVAGLLACGVGCGGKGDGAAKSGAPGAAGKPGAPAGGGGRKPLEFPVEVEAVTPRRVEYAVRAVGSIEAFEQVQVTARIAGAVDKLDFAEGDRVKAGQVLVEIEPRRFQIAVESALAALARTKAELAEMLFERVGLNKREAKDMVETFFDEIRDALERGESVKLSGFGNFQLRDKPQRPGRNPKTGEEIPISARRVVTFHASQKLKALIERLPPE